MVRRMQRQGLVEVGADKRIRLSGKGVDGGEDIVRRHRLAEWLVVRLMGMDLHQAHIEAHRLEHGMSPEFQEKLMERLGLPGQVALWLAHPWQRRQIIGRSFDPGPGDAQGCLRGGPDSGRGCGTFAVSGGVGYSPPTMRSN